MQVVTERHATPLSLREDYEQRVKELADAVERATKAEQMFLAGDVPNREANAACADLLHRRRAFAVWLMDNHAELFALSPSSAVAALTKDEEKAVESAQMIQAAPRAYGERHMRQLCTTVVSLTDKLRAHRQEIERLRSVPSSTKAITWPKAKLVGRMGEMAPRGEMTLMMCLQDDGDVIVEVHEVRHREVYRAQAEFCTIGAGGGQSPRTREALIALMVAIEADNASSPHRAWPPVSPPSATGRISEPVLGECEECGQTIVSPLKRLPETVCPQHGRLPSKDGKCPECGALPSALTVRLSSVVDSFASNTEGLRLEADTWNLLRDDIAKAIKRIQELERRNLALENRLADHAGNA